MRSYYSLSALCAITLAIVQAPAHALSLGSEKPAGVTWTLVEQEVEGQPGATVIVHVKGEIPKNYHTYTLTKYKAGMGPSSTKVKIEPKETASLVEADVTYDPAPHVDEESTKAFGNKILAFENTVIIALPIKIAATATTDIKLSIQILSTMCDKNTCLPETTTQLTPIVFLKKKVSNAATDFTFTTVSGALHRELEWTLADSQRKLALHPGELVEIHVKCMIENGWHTFAPMHGTGPDFQFIAVTAFSIDPFIPKDSEKKGETDKPKGVVLGAIANSKITMDRDPVIVFEHNQNSGHDIQIKTFVDAVVFTIPVFVDAKLKAGTYPLNLRIRSQACRDVGQKVCKEISGSVEAELTIVEGKAMAIAATTDDDITQDKGLWAFLWTAAFYGLISLLTPCVFPMIPITVSFFTKREHVSHAHAVRDALIFSAGIVFTFVGLGFFLALVMGQSVRNLAANPWVNLGIFVVFMVMAGNLLGYYELAIPSGILNALNKKASKGNSVLSLLLMGLVFSMTSFTCTGPFIGTVMVWAVNGGNWVWPLLGTTVFAMVFAAPFFLLALFPTALKTLPKSGGWLNSVKVVMGLVEIAAALKFLSSADLVWHWGILTHQAFVIIWLIIAAASVAYLFGVIRFPHDTPLKKRGFARMAFAGVFIIIAGLLVADLAGYHATLGDFVDSTLPPREYPPKDTDDWESGIAAARKAGKPVFFDFTGRTCVNCRLMEGSMFKKKEVEDLLNNFVVIRLYTDVRDDDASSARSDKNARDQKERFQKETLPFYVIVNPDGNEVVTFPKGFTQDVKEFTDFLKRGITTKAAPPSTASTPVPVGAPITAQN